MFRRMTKREQKILVLCLLLGFVFIGYRGMYIPLQEKSQELDNKIIISNKKLRKNLRIIKKAEASSAKHELYLKQFKQNGENEQVMSWVIAEIKEVAGDLEVKISDLKPQRVETKENLYNQFPVTLRLQSSLPEVMHFLYILQTEPYYFSVSDIKFDKSSRRKSDKIKTSLLLNKVYIP